MKQPQHRICFLKHLRNQYNVDDRFKNMSFLSRGFSSLGDSPKNQDAPHTLVPTHASIYPIYALSTTKFVSFIDSCLPLSFPLLTTFCMWQLSSMSLNLAAVVGGESENI